MFFFSFLKFIRMTKNTNPQDLNTLTHFYFFKKLKQFNLPEPFLAFLGFILVTCLFIACFFYLNYQAVIFHRFPWFGLSVAASSALQAEATALNVNQLLDFWRKVDIVVTFMMGNGFGMITTHCIRVQIALL